MKIKSCFACAQCGHTQNKWFGRCPQCGEWNTAVEEVQRPRSARESALESKASDSPPPQPLPQIETLEASRYATGYAEVDRVLGGGMLPGTAVLLGGEPGIGKSTLLLQIAGSMAERYGRVLYISGEESPQQIKLRADRLGVKSPELLVQPETRLEEIIALVRRYEPFLAVIDSIQTCAWSELTSAPGSVGQVRDCTALLVRLAKETGSALVLVGHVTKEGLIAGPRMLEHLVDVVLYFEGDRHQNYRLLRGAKNRFGSTYEVGIFEMASAGLLEVPNPAALFAGEGGARPSGSAVTVSLEGNRPLLIEVQALAAPFHGYGFPRRAVSGVDPNRLAMILAVLEKRLQLPLGTRDIFVNVTGGITLGEPAADLGIAAAILSSFFDIPVPPYYSIIGEIGLSGEVRPVRGAEQRLAESRQLGYEHAVFPYGNTRELARRGIDLKRVAPVKSVEECERHFFKS